MPQQQPIRTSPDRGLIITEEMVIERFRRTLLVFGREVATGLFVQYDQIFSGFPGWDVTRWKLENILLSYDSNRLASAPMSSPMLEQAPMSSPMLEQAPMSSPLLEQAPMSSPLLEPRPEPKRCDLSDRHIRWALERLMEEKFTTAKGRVEPLFNQQTHYQGVFRVLADERMYGDDDFDFFDALMERVLPSQVNSPYVRQSVKNISQTLFNKPFDKWTYDSCLMKKRAPFDRMVAIARRFRELLYTAE